MIRSADNDKLKTIRKLQQKRWRDKLGLFAAEGEDLVAAAERAGWRAEFVLRAGEDVEPELLAAASALGSGSRVIGVYERRWAEPGGTLSVWLHAVEDPGNVGTIIRSAHALADGPVVLGPGCADPFSPKAVRASMGSVFARPPARGALAGLPGLKLALSAQASRTLREAELSPPVVLCLGAERAGLPAELEAESVKIEVHNDSLNVAMAATVALYETANRMAAHG
ncbi:MAG: RNA methyltransferase [Thermoleophilaceae bacterium]